MTETLNSTLEGMKAFFWTGGSLIGKRKRQDEEELIVPNPLATTIVVSSGDGTYLPLANLSGPAPASVLSTNGGGPLLQQQTPQQVLGLLQPSPVVSAKKPRISVAETNALGQQQQMPPQVTAPVLAAKHQVVISPPTVITSAANKKNPTRFVSEDRRQKNREAAKQSRIRKKNEHQLLEQQLEDLQKENSSLKRLIKAELPDAAPDIIGHDCYNVQKNPFPKHTNLQGSAPSTMGRNDFELIESLTRESHAFVLTDPRLPDNPIVYASPSFCQLTQYQRSQVIGRNCRFLQGPQTCPKAIQQIRHAIETGSDCTVRLLNFKQDGTPFWNQFFLAALHDKNSRIVNYVGVQSSVESPTAEELERMQDYKPQARVEEEIVPLQIIEDSHDDLSLDWAELAKSLEADFMDGNDADMDLNNLDMPLDLEQDDHFLSPFAEQLELDAALATDPLGTAQSGTQPPTTTTSPAPMPVAPTPIARQVVTQTVKSELVSALLESQGNVTTPKFMQALTLLSSIYQSNTIHSGRNDSTSPLLHGPWRSLSRPSYSGCLGQNENDEFVYTLGKMSFNMFKPGNLRCTVQRTITTIQPVCEMGKAPRAAPFSLRRELAMHESPETSNATPHTMLNSYDISVALTIEPSDFEASPGETIPAPDCRLRALKVIHGFFLPDPSTPNRLTVWFTDGQLSPVNEPGFGGLNEWKQLFGGDHKRTWSESLSVMGAKVFLGAELPKGMDPDGAMSYTLHRPYGGHGKGYVDILYLDEDLFITKGNYGTIHVVAKNM